MSSRAWLTAVLFSYSIPTLSTGILRTINMVCLWSGMGS